MTVQPSARPTPDPATPTGRFSAAKRRASFEAYALDPLRETGHLEARSARDLADWLAWLELGGSAPRTLDAYERTIAALLIDYPEKTLPQFTDGDLMALLMKYPAPSRRIRKAHLSSFFKWARLTRRIEANPIDLLPTMKRPSQPVIDTFTPAEVAALCALPSPDGHLMRLLLEAGLRKGEAINLTRRRLDFANFKVIVKEGAKGSKDRAVPMTDELATALANLVFLEAIEKDEYLWYDRPGGTFAIKVRRNKPIADTSFHRWWVRCLEDARVDYRKPHTTRHTYATWMNSIGVPMEEIQQLMGHASISTTADLYVHTKVDAIGDRMRALIAAKAQD